MYALSQHRGGRVRLVSTDRIADRSRRIALRSLVVVAVAGLTAAMLAAPGLAGPPPKTGPSQVTSPPQSPPASPKDDCQVTGTCPVQPPGGGVIDPGSAEPSTTQPATPTTQPATPTTQRGTPTNGGSSGTATNGGGTGTGTTTGGADGTIEPDEAKVKNAASTSDSDDGFPVLLVVIIVVVILGGGAAAAFAIPQAQRPRHLTTGVMKRSRGAGLRVRPSSWTTSATRVQLRPPKRSVGDHEQAPRTGNALQIVLAAVLESMPDPATSIGTAAEVKSWPADALSSTRAAMCMPMPAMSVPVNSISPVCNPALISKPRGRRASWRAEAQRMARPGPSKVASILLLVVRISRPRC